MFGLGKDKKEEKKEKGIAGKGKVLSGVVVSTKMKDTCVVEVANFSKHPKYGKYIKKNKKYSVHDAGNECAEGQKVEIRETKPFSKTKRFEIIK